MIFSKASLLIHDSLLNVPTAPLRVLATLSIMVCCLCQLAPPLKAETFYVRADGGSEAQCDGRANTPFTGGGSCAWSHPFVALPPGGTPLLSGGDTLIIGQGSYQMGIGAPNTESCQQPFSYDCTLPPIPSGISAAQPTRILGEGWNSGCASPPELWGTERPWQVLSVRGSRDVEVQCLELTDHSGCIEFHADPATRCERDNGPFGAWASNGLNIDQARNVTFVDLNIHGLANNGVFGDGYRDLTFLDVKVNGNGFAGFNLDSNLVTPPNVGTIVFDHVEIGWNGCGETYPGGEIHGCWAQSNGGYGDGVGTAAYVGDWIIRDSYIHHNTSDGLDLLYALTGSQVTVERSRFERNAGNQLKTSGDLVVDSSSLISECSIHEDFPHMLDPCRALGSALSVAHHQGNTSIISGSTITGEGDCHVVSVCRTACEGTSSIVMNNNVLIGGEDYHTPGDTTCLHWSGNSIPISWNNNVIWETKGDCPAGNLCVDPLVADSTLATFDGALTSASPARGYAAPGSSSGSDLRGVPAQGAPDAGAFEHDGIFGGGFESGHTRRWRPGD